MHDLPYIVKRRCDNLTAHNNKHIYYTSLLFLNKLFPLHFRRVVASAQPATLSRYNRLENRVYVPIRCSVVDYFNAILWRSIYSTGRN